MLEHGGVDLQVYGPRLRVDGDDVAVADQGDRSADLGLRADVADAKPAGGAGEPAVGDQGHLVGDPLAVDGGRGRQHLPHAGPAAGSLVADHQHVAGFVVALLHRGETGLLAVEHAGGATVLGMLQTGHLHHGAIGSQRAPEAHHSPCR